jgi:hypothetical protein
MLSLCAQDERTEHQLPRDLAADVADDAAEPWAQQRQLPAMAIELLGMGIWAADFCAISVADGIPSPIYRRHTACNSFKWCSTWVRIRSLFELIWLMASLSFFNW